MVCASLVEYIFDGDSNTFVYRFIHRSAFEFFDLHCREQEARCDQKPGNLEYFVPAIYEAEAELAAACLSYIVSRAPAKPLSGDMFESASREQVTAALPFLDYATLYWPSHLIAMKQMLLAAFIIPWETFFRKVESLLRLLSAFFLNKLVPMSWVEAIYIFAPSMDIHFSMYSQLLEWADWAATLDVIEPVEDLKDVLAAASAFFHDLLRMHQLWGDTLRASPHSIWNDITAFTPSPFFVQTSAVTVKSLVTESVLCAGLSSKPLSRISANAVGGDLLGVLTIWPSR